MKVLGEGWWKTAAFEQISLSYDENFLFGASVLKVIIFQFLSHCEDESGKVKEQITEKLEIYKKTTFKLWAGKFPLSTARDLAEDVGVNPEEGPGLWKGVGVENRGMHSHAVSGCLQANQETERYQLGG